MRCGVESRRHNGAQLARLFVRVGHSGADIGLGMYAQLTDPQGAAFRVLQLVPELLASL